MPLATVAAAAGEGDFDGGDDRMEMFGGDDDDGGGDYGGYDVSTFLSIFPHFIIRV